ncbi:MAG: permease YjgP/YjgQ family protein [Firmicutes bacterium]|nr:permease YjgP/YjgQ family protein [Bacillota bacterium]
MRILDRYIIKEMVGAFIFGIFAFSSVFIGSSTLFRIAQYVTQYGASTQAVIKLFVYSLPSIIVLTFPMSMLLATLLSFGRLSASSEITAMKSGGISFYRIATPVFFIALFVSIFAILFNEHVVPRANEAYNNIVFYEIQGNTAPKSQEHLVIKEIKNDEIERLTYARRYDAETTAMYGVAVQEFEKGKLVRVQNAEKANWSSDHWTMYTGTLNELSEEGSVQRTLKFEQQILPIKQNPNEIAKEQKKPEEMTMRELRYQIKALEAQSVDTNKLKSELYKRITIPFASFVFALIGVPLGLQPNRTSSSIGFGLSIIVIFIYYTIMTIFSALGQGGTLPPLIAAWIPNIVGTIVGIALIRKAAR